MAPFRSRLFEALLSWLAALLDVLETALLDDPTRVLRATEM